MRILDGTSKHSTSLCRMFAITVLRDALTNERLASLTHRRNAIYCQLSVPRLRKVYDQLLTLMRARSTGDGSSVSRAGAAFVTMYAGGCTYLCSQPSTEQTLQKRPCGERNTLFGPHAKLALQNSPPVSTCKTTLAFCRSLTAFSKLNVASYFAPAGC